MEISGIVKKVGDTQDITQTFKKREIVVTTEEQYPQHLMVEFTQDKTSLLDNFNVGDKVTIGINLRGREWTSPQGEVKYFNSIQGWRIEKNQPGAQGGNSAPDQSSSSAGMPEMPPMADDEDDDLPF